MRTIIILAALGGLTWLALAADAPDAVPVTPAALTASPLFQRIEIPPSRASDGVIALTSSTDATLLAADIDCACVHISTAFPLPMVAHHPVDIHYTAAGVLPGIKSLTFRSTNGTARVALQVVSAGLGDGRSALDALLASADRQHGQVWFLLPNLHGAMRNCGCSSGSLGGIDHLAAFPAWYRSGHTTAALFLLLGDTDGPHPGIGLHLKERGWQDAGPDVMLSNDPEKDVQNQHIVAVLPTRPTTINHRNLVDVPLSDGMLLSGLVIVDGHLMEQRLIPVDASLPSDVSALAWTRPLRTMTILNHVLPSQDCRSCHESAFQRWSLSAHRHAFDALPAADRTDDCMTCHTLTVTASSAAPDVHCQSCHAGTDRHLASSGRVHTAVAVDCRSCHDARHHPGFDPVAAWIAIRH